MSEGIYNKYSGYHNRKSIRLKGYDYSRPGYYFVTTCIHDRKQKMFGDVVNGKMVLNDAGEYVRQCWLDIPMHFPHIKLDEYVVMPNHVHGIIIICDLSDGVTGGVIVGANVFVGANNYSPLQLLKNPHRQKQTHNTAPFCGTSKTIGSIVRGFKISVTKWFSLTTPDIVIWQRNYWDHIIRNEKSLCYIRKYIRENPAQWSGDSENHLSIEEKEMDECFEGP